MSKHQEDMRNGYIAYMNDEQPPENASKEFLTGWGQAKFDSEHLYTGGD